MTWRLSSSSLPSYSDSTGTFALQFLFPEAADETGETYSGRTVEAFLPATETGVQVLELFQVAFRRKLLFTIATSLTTGFRRPTFNIHLKTSRSGSMASHGYPDPTYLTRALRELADHGIQPSSSPGLGVRSLDHNYPNRILRGSADHGIRPSLRPGLLEPGSDLTNLNGAVREFGHLAIPPSLHWPMPQSQVARSHRNERQPGSQTDISAGISSSTAAGSGQSSSSSSSSYQQSSVSIDLIPCEFCDALVPLEQYAAHVSKHDSKHADCSFCGVTFDAEHVPGNGELCPECQASVTLDALPVDLAMQVVKMIECAGIEIPHDFRVCNYDLAVKFIQELLSHCACGRKMIEIVYHWTHKDNVSAIVDNNLRVPGDVNADGSKVVTVNGERYGRGIYAATDFNYGRHYGRGAPVALVCLANPGLILHGRKKIGARLPSGHVRNAADSVCDGPLRVYRSSDQLLPLFITDAEHQVHIHEAVQGVVKLLSDHTPASPASPASQLGGA